LEKIQSIQRFNSIGLGEDEKDRIGFFEMKANEPDILIQSQEDDSEYSMDEIELDIGKSKTAQDETLKSSLNLKVNANHGKNLIHH
jgi:hypothetical protein